MASIQLSKSQPSPARAGSFVLSWFMAWSPLRRANAGISWVRKPGDYANLFPPLPGRHPVEINPAQFAQYMTDPVESLTLTRCLRTRRSIRGVVRIDIQKLHWRA